MATPTYDLLDSTTLASAASSVTFSSIDQSYGDLVLVATGGMSSGSSLEIQFNGDTSSTTSPSVYMDGNGSSGSSATATRSFITFSTADSLGIMQVMDYPATEKHKPLLIRSNTGSIVRALAGRWANTSAITSIKLLDTGGASLTSGSTFSLFGIAS